MYDFAEITNAFDWEIREDLDDAERDLEDNVSFIVFSAFIQFKNFGKTFFSKLVQRKHYFFNKTIYFNQIL